MSATDAYGGASAAAIQHHYDVSNAFYALWLDPTLTYSCALWESDDEPLRTAQERKLDYLATGARAGHGARVLDVGCGWGGMLRRLVDVHGARRAVGLTLSVAQAEHVNAFGDERCTATVENWADHVPPDGGYDAIVSIGAFEHFADFGMTRERRVAAYRAFFDRCREWLPPGGRIGLQTMLNGSNTNLDRETTRELLFIVDRIFPESQIPWLSEVIEAAERRFDVVTVRNDPDHYARTCATWHAALVARRGDAVALVGEEVVADYERYLSASSRHLARRHLGLGRLILERV